MQRHVLILALVVVGYNVAPDPILFPDQPSLMPQQTLRESREGFDTQIVKPGESYSVLDSPTGNEFELIRYESPGGRWAAYVTTDPDDGKKHPAIVWITGGGSLTC
ncbi:MAG: hypothetical protein MKZ95_03640 [Pirellulales bacterium]|nr:hypothetical protein [Pirellulales bacterium]